MDDIRIFIPTLIDAVKYRHESRHSIARFWQDCKEPSCRQAVAAIALLTEKPNPWTYHDVERFYETEPDDGEKRE